MGSWPVYACSWPAYASPAPSCAVGAMRASIVPHFSLSIVPLFFFWRHGARVGFFQRKMEEDIEARREQEEKDRQLALLWSDFHAPHRSASLHSPVPSPLYSPGPMVPSICVHVHASRGHVYAHTPTHTHAHPCPPIHLADSFTSSLIPTHAGPHTQRNHLHAMVRPCTMSPGARPVRGSWCAEACKAVAHSTRVHVQGCVETTQGLASRKLRFNDMSLVPACNRFVQQRHMCQHARIKT